jgi:hypothetical protein
MESAHNQIKNSILKKRKGTIVFAEDFKKIGDGGTIRVSLFRLCKEHFLIRLANGIFLYPRIDKKFGLGVIYPSIFEIAKEIAKREKSRLMPTGVYAMNRLGLSTQVPAKVIFLTDGAPRTIKIGKNATIKFQKTTAKNLAFKGKITQLVVSALKEIGKENVTDEQLQKIGQALYLEKNKTIEHDAELAPEWISKIILQYRHDA